MYKVVKTFRELREVLRDVPFGSDMEKEILEKLSKLAKSFGHWHIILIHSTAHPVIKAQAFDNMAELAETDKQHDLVIKNSPYCLVTDRPKS